MWEVFSCCFVVKEVRGGGDTAGAEVENGAGVAAMSGGDGDGERKLNDSSNQREEDKAYGKGGRADPFVVWAQQGGTRARVFWRGVMLSGERSRKCP